MATYTPNYNLIKPDYEEPADVAQLNNNADLIDAALSEKQDTLTFDTAPTSGSANPVTSGGVKAALDNAENSLSEAIDTKAPVVECPSGTDADTLTTSGLYQIGTSGVNLPNSATNGYILVISNSAGTRAKQLFSRHGTQSSNDSQTYVRQWNGSTWSDWVRLIDDADRIPWASTTDWATAVAGAKMDILAVAEITGGSSIFSISIEIPVIDLTSSYKFFFASFHNGTDVYAAQIRARISSQANFTTYKNNAQLTSEVSTHFLYR